MTGISPPAVALLSDFDGWHEAELRAALARHRIGVERLSLRDCTLAGRPQLPGFGNRLPAAVLVRFVPGGSFEQVTLRLSVLHALAELGVVVYNSARVIERTVDKAHCSFLLARAGVATPAAWALESRAAAAARVASEHAAGRRVVLKPLFGARGQGLELIDDADALPPPEAVAGVYYLQRFAAAAVKTGALWRDWRVLVIGGRAVAVMERRAEHWVTNRARGGQCVPAALTVHRARLAERAAAAVGAAYAGVDLTRDRAGRLQVLEVNGVPAWQGLQSVWPQNIAVLLVADLRRRLSG